MKKDYFTFHKRYFLEQLLNFILYLLYYWCIRGGHTLAPNLNLPLVNDSIQHVFSHFELVKLHYRFQDILNKT